MAGDADKGQDMSVKKPGFPGFLREWFLLAPVMLQLYCTHGLAVL
jgi:hypothetical protein